MTLFEIACPVPAYCQRSGRDKLTIAAIGLGLAVFLWFFAACNAWKYRNPAGSDLTFFTHFQAAMTFQRLPPLQEKIMSSTPSFNTDIRNCARCGGNHEDLLFWKLRAPCLEYQYWCPCPDNGEPILLHRDEPVSAGDKP